jgi:hypothetical protein
LVNDSLGNLFPEPDYDDLRELIEECKRASEGLDEMMKEIAASGNYEALLREIVEAAGETEGGI